MNTTAVIPVEKIKPLVAWWVPDQMLMDLVQYADNMWAEQYADDSREFVHYVFWKESDVSLDLWKYLLSKWWDVLNKPLRVCVDSTDEEVPFETEEEMTWAERATHTPVQGVNKKRYVSCSNGIIERPLSELTPAIDKLVDRETFISEMPQSDE